VVSGSKITMEKPHLSGFTRDSRAYELSAAAASQDLTKPDIVNLRDIHAKVQMKDNSMLRLSAVDGTYDSKAETLKLDRDIELSSSAGYAGQLSEAMIDIRQGHVVSDHPVHVKLLQGTLEANRLEIMHSGELVRFEGGVSMTMMLNKNLGKANATATAPAKAAAPAPAKEAGQ
jgi:lipopolysaccharide export system protein LptC